MKEIKIGSRVQIHPTGTVFRVLDIKGRHCQLIDDKTGEEYPLTPISMLDVVQD